MSAHIYDSRAWTGDLPDYRGILRRWLGLDCPVTAYFIAVHFASPVSPEARALIERYCKARGQ